MTPRAEALKVAYVIGELGVGGAERQLLKKMVLLRDRGVEIVLIALSSGGSLAAEFHREGFRVHQLPRSHSVELKRFRRLTKLLRDERPHIVHGEQYQAGGYARLAGILAGVPVRIQAIRSAYPNLRRRYRAAELVLKHVTHAYMVNAEAIKRRTVAYHAIDPDRVFVIPNVYDAAEKPTRPPERVRAELELDPSDRVIGMIASLEPEKNHRLLIDFAEALSRTDPHVRFLLVGDGVRRPDVEARITERGLERTVRLLGLRSDVPDILQVLDLSMNCSIREGLCNALIESIANGVPVLASRVGGTPEIVTEGVHGELFESGSLDGMLAAYARMREELPRYRERIRAQLPAFVARYSGEAAADAMQSIYLRCVRERGIRLGSTASSDLDAAEPAAGSEGRT